VPELGASDSERSMSKRDWSQAINVQEP
jgi:hypothetical protein